MNLKLRLCWLYGMLAALNLGAWVWAFLAFRASLVPLALALMVYGLGLRHAVDADHIAAIDNVTRKLMAEGKRPVAVGFYFAMGHSAVVVLVTLVVAATAGALDAIHDIGRTLGTGISALFLFVIAALNIAILVPIWRTLRRARAGGRVAESDLDPLSANRGMLARLFRPAFRLVGKSWHMLLLGLLFGLGFDTATEVAMYGVAVAQAANGASLAAILVLPVLFAAAMSLVDTTDGVMMLGAYGWAFVDPLRKLYYNLAITLLSIVVALAVGGIGLLGLVGDELGFDGALWRAVAALGDNLSTLGFALVALFLATWLLSRALYRARRPDLPASS